MILLRPRLVDPERRPTCLSRYHRAAASATWHQLTQQLVVLGGKDDVYKLTACTDGYVKLDQLLLAICEVKRRARPHFTPALDVVRRRETAEIAAWEFMHSRDVAPGKCAVTSLSHLLERFMNLDHTFPFPRVIYDSDLAFPFS